MTEDADLLHLQEYDRRIGEIEGLVGDLFTHLDSEVVGHDSSGNPQLRYREPKYTHRLKELERMGGAFDAESYLGKILEKRWLASMDKLWAIDAIGSPDFTERSIDYFQNLVPTQEDVGRAKRIIMETSAEDTSDESSKMVYAFGLRDRMEASLKRKGLLGQSKWNVVIVNPREGERIPMLCTDKASKRIRICVDYKNPDRVARISKLHEVDGHVMQWQNGLEQPLPNTFFHGVDGRSVMTSEGIIGTVLRNEGYEPNNRKYAACLIAVDAALREASYMDVVEMMEQNFGFTDKDAKDIAYRAKRGLSDTSKGGGFPKDAAYMLGDWAVQKYVERKGDLSKLYIGNIALEDIAVIDWLLGNGTLKPARYLPDFLSY
ncbi:MAG: DUF1704 domain-containing protein [Candidatus Aenigmatarchaeota archaeon]|nr:MAG: DUF1704 domain-containing protein [Candidatus Aenigmarchaeota archaeon]